MIEFIYNSFCKRAIEKNKNALNMNPNNFIF